MQPDGQTDEQTYGLAVLSYRIANIKGSAIMSDLDNFRKQLK